MAIVAGLEINARRESEERLSKDLADYPDERIVQLDRLVSALRTVAEQVSRAELDSPTDEHDLTVLKEEALSLVDEARDVASALAGAGSFPVRLIDHSASELQALEVTSESGSGEHTSPSVRTSSNRMSTKLLNTVSQLAVVRNSYRPDIPPNTDEKIRQLVGMLVAKHLTDSRQIKYLAGLLVGAVGISLIFGMLGIIRIQDAELNLEETVDRKLESADKELAIAVSTASSEIQDEADIWTNEIVKIGGNAATAVAMLEESEFTQVVAPISETVTAGTNDELNRIEQRVVDVENSVWTMGPTLTRIRDWTIISLALIGVVAIIFALVRIAKRW